MLGFENGYDFFMKNTGAYIGTDKAAQYVGDVEAEIEKAVRNLNAFERFNTDSKILKGDIAEFWHSDTFNIKAVVAGSDSRTWVDRSHDFASTDISSNYGESYGLKYYASGEASAKAQAISVFERFSQYKSSGGQDNLEVFLTERGYHNFDEILNDPLYTGQIRIIPRDQFEEATMWLQRMINTESVRRPEQVYRYQETLDVLRDRLTSNDGVESIPLSKAEAEILATLAKKGGFNAEEFGLTPEKLIEFEHIMRQSFKAGMTAATIAMMLKIAPEICKAISYLAKNGELDIEQFKKMGFVALSGASEGFIRGTIAAALTTYCKAGLLGDTMKMVDPTFIGVITVVTMNVIKNAFSVVNGSKEKRELIGELIRDMYISTCALIGGGLTQGVIEVPILGYIIGSFIGSIVGSFTYNIGQKAVITFCVDSGFTMFGLVEQDYTMPKELLKEMGLELFDYETFDIESFQPDSFAFDTFSTDTFEPDTLNITFLRRGVIGVSTVGYLE